MAFNFIKKVFSFGRKQAEEKEQVESRPEELKPLGLPEQTAPAPQEPQPVPPAPPEPDPTPTEPEKTPEVPPPAPQPIEPEPTVPEAQPAVPEPQPAPAPAEIPTAPAAPETAEKTAAVETQPLETSVAEAAAAPVVHDTSEAAEAPTSQSREESIGEAEQGRIAAEPDAPVEEALRPVETTSETVAETPDTPVGERPSVVETIALEAQPAPEATETPRAAETTPSGPLGHLPLGRGEEVAPTSPSPLRGGSLGEVERGGVASEPDAPVEEAPRPTEAASEMVAEKADTPVDEPPTVVETIALEAQPAPDVNETTRAAEITPSGPAGHLPLEGGEEVAPKSLSFLRGGSIGKVERGGVATELGASTEQAPAPAGKVTVAKKVQQKAESKPVEAAPKLSWFQRLKQGLSRSSKELSTNIAGVFTKRKLDEETLQDLEDVLIRADLGMETAIRVTDALSSGRYGKNVSDDEVRTIMAEEVEKVLKPVAMPLELDLSHKPHVILVVGVNGTGKTTTIGKLAAKLVEGGLAVTMAAGDTFRAAAIEQLKIWGERTGSPVVSSKLGADAAGLAYDAFEKAKQAGSDVLIIDTAGRLQNKAELMAELEKIVRVLGKLDPEAPHTVLQTVDATTGQNALNQVEIFRNVAGVNGLVMTKLDGTARGGILVAIAAKHKLPVYFIGVGEQVDDLEPFSASDFAKAIAGVA